MELKPLLDDAYVLMAGKCAAVLGLLGVLVFFWFVITEWFRD